MIISQSKQHREILDKKHYNDSNASPMDYILYVNNNPEFYIINENYRVSLLKNNIITPEHKIVDKLLRFDAIYDDKLVMLMNYMETIDPTCADSQIDSFAYSVYLNILEIHNPKHIIIKNRNVNLFELTLKLVSNWQTNRYNNTNDRENIKDIIIKYCQDSYWKNLVRITGDESVFEISSAIMFLVVEQWGSHHWIDAELKLHIIDKSEIERIDLIDLFNIFDKLE